MSLYVAVEDPATRRFGDPRHRHGSPNRHSLCDHHATVPHAVDAVASIATFAVHTEVGAVHVHRMGAIGRVDPAPTNFLPQASRQLLIVRPRFPVDRKYYTPERVAERMWRRPFVNRKNTLGKCGVGRIDHQCAGKQAVNSFTSLQWLPSGTGPVVVRSRNVELEPHLPSLTGRNADRLELSTRSRLKPVDDSRAALKRIVNRRVYLRPLRYSNQRPWDLGLLTLFREYLDRQARTGVSLREPSALLNLQIHVEYAGFQFPCRYAVVIGHNRGNLLRSRHALRMASQGVRHEAVIESAKYETAGEDMPEATVAHMHVCSVDVPHKDGKRYCGFAELSRNAGKHVGMVTF